MLEPFNLRVSEPFNLRVSDVLNANALGFEDARPETLCVRQGGVEDAMREAARASNEIRFTIVARPTGSGATGVVDVKRLSLVTYR